MAGFRYVTGAGALALALLGPGTAAADAIDGNWCNTDGRRFLIEGPRIVTPRGTRMTGDYDRHGFRYVVPPSEPGAGGEILMNLLDEYTLHLMEGADSAPQTWHRCAPATS